MATSRLIPMRVSKGKTIGQTITDRTDYAVNPAKTDDGELVSAYECDPATVDAEFLLSKRQYRAQTGRTQSRDVLAYQLRQSFKPGEVSPEEANRIGYELAMRWTKGKHAFIVATHIDKAHVHNHIIYNSTTLDCTRKFRNFWGSTAAVRRLNDTICLAHGLSIVEQPKHHGMSYGKWLGDQKKPSQRDLLRQAIDAALAKKPRTFDAFLAEITAAGYEVKRGKHMAFRAEGMDRFIRLRSLGDSYSEEAIRAVLAEERAHAPQKKTILKPMPERVNLLVDIQAKLQAGKGGGYERWAKVFNLKQMAQTINYLSEHKLLDYGDLESKASAATARFNILSAQINAAEKRIAELTALRKNIFQYRKTRDVYLAYRKAGYSKQFYAEHESEILLHKAAKAAFNALPGKKIPPLSVLQAEYDALLLEKKSAYGEYVRARKEMQEILTAKANVDTILGKERGAKDREQERT